MLFADVLEIKNGRNQRAVENPNGKYPIYGSGGIMGYADDYICDAETVIIGRKGSINNPIYVEEPFWNVDTAFGLVANKRLILPRYLFYFCKNYDFERLNKTVTIPSLTKSDLLKIEINVPEILTQQMVIDKLFKVEKTLTLCQLQCQKLDELIKSRFVEMFGDKTINNKMWKSEKLRNCAAFRNGKAHEQVVDENGKFILVTSKAIASDFSDVRKTNALLSPLFENDIVMVMSDVPNGRALAKCQIIDNNDVYTLNQRICCFSNYSFNPVFLLYLLSRHPYFLSFNDGNGQTNLRKNDILDCELIIPPTNLQNEFADFVAKVEQQKAIVQKSIDHLETLKKSLMQEYFG